MKTFLLLLFLVSFAMACNNNSNSPGTGTDTSNAIELPENRSSDTTTNDTAILKTPSYADSGADAKRDSIRPR